MGSWTDHLRAGKPPDWVLAHLLASEEYYQRAGGTPEGFVRSFFLDVTGREPSRQDYQTWAPRLRTEDRAAVAARLIQAYPQALAPLGDAGDRHYLSGAQEQVRRLISEVEHLQEDVVAELGARKERKLYQMTDDALSDLRHFNRSLKAGYKREHLYEDYARADRKLHELLDAVRALGDDYRVLQRDAQRVRQADQQLHHALSIGDTSDGRGREVVQRQTQALLAEAREFQRVALYALADNREGEHVRGSIGKFTEAVEHAARSLDKGYNRDHVRTDFAAVAKAWNHVVEHLNALSPPEGNNYLRRRAQSVEVIEDQLRRQLGIDGGSRRVILQYRRK